MTTAPDASQQCRRGARLRQRLRPGPRRGKGIARDIDPVEIAVVLGAVLQMVDHLKRGAERVIGGPDRPRLAMDVEDEAADRVYIPRDAFAAAGTGPEALAEPRASPALLACILGLAQRTAGLLEEARPFARRIGDTRLALEVAVIHRLAQRLTRGLMKRDPLSERVHLSATESAPLALAAMGRTILGRLFRRPALERAS